MEYRSRYRDALRILFILVNGAYADEQNEIAHVRRVFPGESRLLAFEFWMRNPDYLADELMDLFEATHDAEYLRAVEQIFALDEPDVRRFPMIRYRFGAFERVDDALAILVCRGLIRVLRREIADRTLETDYLLFASAIELTEHVTNEFPALAWYRDRSKLIANLAGDRGGRALKQHQYRKIEYAETELGGTIPAITTRVWNRFESFRSIGGVKNG